MVCIYKGQIWEAELSNWGKGLVPVFGTREDIPSVQCPVWDCSIKGGAWQTGWSPVQGYQRGWKQQHTVQRERLKETRFSFKQGRQMGDLTAVFYCLKALIMKMLFPRGQKTQGSHHTSIAAHRIPAEHKFFPGGQSWERWAVRLWKPHPWRCSKFTCTRPSITQLSFEVSRS